MPSSWGALARHSGFHRNARVNHQYPNTMSATSPRLQARMATRLATLTEAQCRELLAEACAQFNRVRAACDAVIACTGTSVPFALPPDMLEMVLSHVSTMTLHRAMRVSRDWCHVARRPQLHRVIAVSGFAPHLKLPDGSSSVDPKEVGPQQLSDDVILDDSQFTNRSLTRCVSLAAGGMVELRLSHLCNLFGTEGFQLLPLQTSFKALDVSFCPRLVDAVVLPLLPPTTTYLSVFQCAPDRSQSMVSLPTGLAGRCVECKNILSFQFPPTSSRIARMRLRPCDACGTCRCDGDPEPCVGAFSCERCGRYLCHSSHHSEVPAGTSAAVVFGCDACGNLIGCTDCMRRHTCADCDEEFCDGCWAMRDACPRCQVNAEPA